MIEKIVNIDRFGEGVIKDRIKNAVLIRFEKISMWFDEEVLEAGWKVEDTPSLFQVKNENLIYVKSGDVVPCQEIAC